MRKELALSVAAPVVMHVLLFVCFPGGRYEEHRETKETRIRREYPVVLLPMPKKLETVMKPNIPLPFGIFPFVFLSFPKENAPQSR